MEDANRALACLARFQPPLMDQDSEPQRGPELDSRFSLTMKGSELPEGALHEQRPGPCVTSRALKDGREHQVTDDPPA